MGAAIVTGSTIPILGAGRGSTPTAALHDLEVRPIPLTVARTMVEKHHYLHSLPGGTRLALGVFVRERLLGAITLGVGPYNAPSLVSGATPDDYLTLTRLWLSGDLPRNSESRVLGIVLRSLRRHTTIKFLISYADPSQGHLGIIYQATNWLYTGLSEAMPLYELGDGRARHSRSVSHAYGSHSVEYLRSHGVPVRLIPQAAKHRYMYFVDPTWQKNLLVPVLPCPKRGA